jgi:hypothetical protein
MSGQLAQTFRAAGPNSVRTADPNYVRTFKFWTAGPNYVRTADPNLLAGLAQTMSEQLAQNMQTSYCIKCHVYCCHLPCQFRLFCLIPTNCRFYCCQLRRSGLNVRT